MLGQRVLRKEDPRFLRGEGRYVENLLFEDALHVAFVRSPVAHARITGIDTSPAGEKAQVFTAQVLDLGIFGPPFLALDEKLARLYLPGVVVRIHGLLTTSTNDLARVTHVTSHQPLL